jgi:hypothetical protein
MYDTYPLVQETVSILFSFTASRFVRPYTIHSRLLVFHSYLAHTPASIQRARANAPYATVPARVPFPESVILATPLDVDTFPQAAAVACSPDPDGPSEPNQSQSAAAQAA